jgi:hypothetical protein
MYNIYYTHAIHQFGLSARPNNSQPSEWASCSQCLRIFQAELFLLFQWRKLLCASLTLAVYSASGWWFCSSAWCYHGFLWRPRQPRVQWGSTTPCHFLSWSVCSCDIWDILRHLCLKRTVFKAPCYHMQSFFFFYLLLSRLPEHRHLVTRLGRDWPPIYPHTWKGLQIFEVLNRDRWIATAKYKERGLTEMDIIWQQYNKWFGPDNHLTALCEASSGCSIEQIQVPWGLKIRCTKSIKIISFLFWIEHFEDFRGHTKATVRPF